MENDDYKEKLKQLFVDKTGISPTAIKNGIEYEIGDFIRFCEETKLKEDPKDITDNIIELPGVGDTYMDEEGIYLRTYNSEEEPKDILILEKPLQITKVSYDYITNQKLLTGYHDNDHFRTLSFSDLFKRLQNYTYGSYKGRDGVKHYIHYLINNAPIYELEEVMGFNEKWNLPFEKNNKQLKICTDKQLTVFQNMKKMYKKYNDEEKDKIKKLMQEFIKRTSVDKRKVAIIIGWAMSSPFRQVFIDDLDVYPYLYCYGDRSTGKSSLLEFFIVEFFNSHENYYSQKVLDSAARFEDVISTSTFPVYVQEVTEIKREILSLMKEHATGISRYFRKKSAREMDFNVLKLSPVAFDSNDVISNMRDSAANTKIILLEFTSNKGMEIDFKWKSIRDQLKKYKIFSLYYDYTKDWTKEYIKNRLQKYKNEVKEILQENNFEKDAPRMISHYILIKFGIELFEEIFDIKLKIDPLPLLLEGRTVLTQSLLDQFLYYCKEAIHFGEYKLPNYIQHKLTDYKDGYLFDPGNLTDFVNFSKEQITMKKLGDDLQNACEDKEDIYYHRTSKTRGIFIKKNLVTTEDIIDAKDMTNIEIDNNIDKFLSDIDDF